MLLKDKVIIVTGAGQGIGMAHAHKLSAEGAAVVLVDLDETNVQKVASELQGNGGRALAMKADVSSVRDTQSMAERTINSFGRIDVLVNNAAIFSDLASDPFWDIDPDAFDRLMAVNVRGVWLCCRAVFPQMRKQGAGKIVNIASGIFWSARPGMAHYVASKGAVIGLTRALARECGEFNINVNAVAPGFTVTEKIAAKYPDAETAGFEAGCFKRPERPADIVGAVAFLSSHESDFMTGQTLVVDGGRVLH